MILESKTWSSEIFTGRLFKILLEVSIVFFITFSWPWWFSTKSSSIPMKNSLKVRLLNPYLALGMIFMEFLVFLHTVRDSDQIIYFNLSFKKYFFQNRHVSIPDANFWAKLFFLDVNYLDQVYSTPCPALPPTMWHIYSMVWQIRNGIFQNFRVFLAFAIFLRNL